MSAKKQVLGRGLDSLIAAPQASPHAPPASPSATDGRRVVDIPVSDLRPNLNQPRSVFDEDHIRELADSIREKGILQPLLVRRTVNGYEIVAGERRFRAAQAVGLQTVPCIPVEVSDESSLEIALIENLQREDLNAMEEARAFKSLMEQFKLSQEQVADRVGKKRPTIANSLRLLNLPLDIQEDLYENRLTAGHARAILSLADAPKQRHLRNVILAKGLSVREAEVLARRLGTDKKPRPPKAVAVEAQMRSLQEAFSLKIGLPVFIRPVTDQAGKVEIQYHNLDDFQIITDFFGIEPS
jgi:ParB family transcriptional regulator, chromosome partitioning protein